MAQQTQRLGLGASEGCKACTHLQRRPVRPRTYCAVSVRAQQANLAETRLSRRQVVSTFLALGLSASSLCKEEALAATDQPSSTLGTAVNAPTPDEDIYVAVEFSLALPPGFRETEVLPPKPAEPRPGFGSFERQVGAAPASPIKARFVSDSGAQISVVVRPAAEIKPTFLQVTDISQYGDIAAAQSVLVPTGAKVLDKSTTKVQQPPRNTGTLAGVFQAPPTTVYRYEFVTGNGLHAVMAAAASKGQVYVAGGTASNLQWQTAGPALRQAVQSFKLN
ncbi:hypothetical protein ABBQ38_002903 [Trebouxia sp. C0009 RCD-2024]